jgi:Rieske Fe-S protein
MDHDERSAPHTPAALDESDLLARRRVLTVLAVAPAFAACALGTAELPAENQDPDYDGGPLDPNNTNPPPGEDSGTTPGMDSAPGTDTGVHDSGTHANETGSPLGDTGGSTPPPTCNPVGTLAGAVSGWNTGTWKKVGNSFVGRDSKGFYALRSICTHNNSCGLRTPTSSGISCPCHGGQFDLDGNVTLSPPPSPLANYQVTVCNGNVYVNTAKTVARGTRAN